LKKKKKLAHDDGKMDRRACYNADLLKLWWFSWDDSR